MPQLDIKDVTIRILDGTTPTPKSIAVKVGEGNLTYSDKRTMEYVKDRGKLDGVREGDEEPVEISLDAVWEFISSPTGEVATVEEAIKGTGTGLAAFVTVGADVCEPYACKIQVDNDLSDCAGTLGERLEFNDFRWETFDHDVRAGTLSISGMANIITPTKLRTDFT